MGNYFTSDMKKNQEAMQRKMMERQMQLQFEMQQRQMAMQIAGSRDFFLWIATFYSIATVGLITGYRKTKRPALIAPLIPLIFVTVFYWDLSHGNKMHRVRTEAEHILAYEKDILKFPGGLPTISSIDLARLNVEEQKSGAAE